MSKEKVYPVSKEAQSRAHIQKEEYEAMYEASIEEPEQFWTKKAEEFISWFQPWETVMEQDFTKGKVRWFVEGKLNASVNCIDRHLKTRGNQTAIIWEGDNPKEEKYWLSYVDALIKGNKYNAAKKAIDQFLSQNKVSMFYEVPFGSCFIIK